MAAIQSGRIIIYIINFNSKSLNLLSFPKPFEFKGMTCFEHWNRKVKQIDKIRCSTSIISHSVAGLQILQISFNPVNLPNQREINTVHDYKNTSRKKKILLSRKPWNLYELWPASTLGSYTLRIIGKAPYFLILYPAKLPRSPAISPLPITVNLILWLGRPFTGAAVELSLTSTCSCSECGPKWVIFSVGKQKNKHSKTITEMCKDMILSSTDF